MVAFPLGKLAYLGIKQLAKPISIQLRSSAARHPFVSKYICVPPAQILHILDTFVKRRLMGIKGKGEYKPLSEERAVEIGSEIIGEAFLFSVASGFIVYEYWRSVRKDQRKEDIQNLEISHLQTQTQRLEQQMLQLQQTLEGLQTQLQTHLDSSSNNRIPSTSDTSQKSADKSNSWWIF